MRVAFDEADVEAALGDAILHRLRVGDEEPRHHRRKARLVGAQHLRQQVIGDGRARADQQGPPSWPLISCSRVSSSAETSRMRSAYSRARLPAAVSEMRPCARSNRRVLKCSSSCRICEGDRRLRHEKRLGRLGEGEVLCDRVEYLEAAIRHRSVRKVTG